MRVRDVRAAVRSSSRTYNSLYAVSLGIVTTPGPRMQPFYGPIAPVYSRRKFLAGALLASLGVAAGCVDRPTTIDAPPVQPHAGVSLTVAVADPADRSLIRQLSRGWSVRSGATVTVTDTLFDGTTD